MLNIIKTIVIEPLILLFELIFQYVFSHTKSAGLSIIVLSFSLNVILFPLYKEVEKLQNEEKIVQNKLKHGIKKIKKAFKGNEQYMILQTYYRQNNYKPIYSLRSILPLLFEIPFFIAAYSFLSDLKCLQERGFLFINNLGIADGLLFGLNILPLLMTLINIISCTIYTKDQPIKSKIQLYLTSIVFLALLYNAPSGLSFYYLLNNVFGLIKNILIKYISVPSKDMVNYSRSDRYIFICCCIFLCLLTGLLIPVQVINASPEEFIDTVDFISPLKYVLNTLLLSIGVFIVWINIFYELMNNKIKKIISMIMLSICFNALLNHLIFKQNLGIISYLLEYETVPSFSILEHAINLLTILIISIFIIFIYKKDVKICKAIISILCISLCPIIIYDSININRDYQDVLVRNSTGTHRANFTLSKDKQNVVVIMLDRAISKYFPYLLEEKPILQEQFSGFTYYPNTISFGRNTNVGTPALFGGYEYIPEEMNKRSNELLVDKHNEALKVLPVLFKSNNFDVSVFDPPYAGYKEISDLSIYYDFPDINTYNTDGTEIASGLKKLNRNLFCYSITRITPSIAFSFFYDGGCYSEMAKIDSVIHTTFLEKYTALCNLINYTKIVESDNGSLVLFQNESTHEPTELQLPDYEPSDEVNNSGYEEQNLNKISLFGDKLQLNSTTQIRHYHVNMASMLRIGEWLDYLKEEGVYDNTKIIIVSDHGRFLSLDPDLIINDEDMLKFNALLLVKDFNSNEFSIDYSFMTNADVPYIATKDIIENPTNPFTGKEIIEIDKNNKIFNILESYWDTSINDGYRFMDGEWTSVHDNIFVRDNWAKIDDPSR